MEHPENTFYWIRMEIAVLLLATAMSLIGTVVWAATIPRPLFSTTDLIVPSCLTWGLLAPWISRVKLRKAFIIGLLSPILGSVFVILLGIGPVAEVQGFVGLFLYAMAFIGITAWTTLPVGALAGVAFYGLFRAWPPPTQQEQVPRLRSIPALRPLFARVLLSLLPLMPLVVLVNRGSPRAPRELVPVWRMLGELYFFPVLWIEGLSMRFEFFTQTIPELGIGLRIAWALLMSVMLFRIVTRLAFRG